MIKFKIWYDDGNSYEGVSEEDWERLPRHGVQIVKSFREKDCVTHAGMDYYFFEDDTIKSVQRVDLDRYLERTQGIKCVKFGRWSADVIWQKAHKEAYGTK